MISLPRIKICCISSVEEARQAVLCGASALGLVSQMPSGPGVISDQLIAEIHVLGEQSIDEAKRIADFVDALLLDSGNPTLQVKELGGTGRVHNWQVSRQIREQVDRPIFLAGGLRASNVSEAIKSVQPFGLDLCSSVRHEGKLSTEKLGDFMQIVRGVA